MRKETAWLILGVCVFLWYFFMADLGPPKYNSLWGPCYNHAYSVNHKKSATVDAPVFVVGDYPVVRDEVYECRDEFVTWINNNIDSAVQYNQMMANKLQRYLMCRDAGRTSEECNS